MSTTSKSPRDVLVTAHNVAAQALPAYAHKFSPKTYTQHQIFACLVLKNFFKTDYRGVAAILRDCAELRDAIGLARVPHFTTLQKAAERLLAAAPAARLLEATVARAGGRRRRVETAAVDSTGLESRHVSPHYLRRRGRSARTRRYTRYPKLDAACDTRSRLILAARPGRGPGADGPALRPLLRRATRRARIGHLVGDAGYDAEAHHRLARDRYGIRTTIPPKRGRPGSKPPTGRYRRLMATRFNRRRYRRRRQVETVFSMIKRRQGAAVAGRGYHSRCRDVNLKVLTHNVMILWRAA